LRVLVRVVVLWITVVCLPTQAGGDEQKPTADRPSRDWKRFSAAGLEVIGNAREADLRKAAHQVAAFRATLEVLMPGVSLSAPEPTTLVVFRDHPSFTEFAPRDARGRRQLQIGGYFLGAPDENYLVLPIFADRRLTYETALHEYTHYVVSRNFRGLPLWLSEGIAEFYATFELDDEGRAIVGRVPSSRVWTLSTERLRPIRALIGADAGASAFGGADVQLFYAQSWLFVHFMTLSDQGKRQGQIVKYLGLLQETKSIDAAAREAFGDLEALDRELRRYVEGFRLRGLRVTGINWEAPEVQPTPLTEAEVAALKGRLLLQLDVPTEAARYSARARQLDPLHVPGQITHARLLSSEGHGADAITELQRICREHPTNFSAQYYLGRALYMEGRYAEAIGAFERALKVRPRASSPWLDLSLTALALGQYAQSDSAMAQLQELYSAPRWHYARAYEAFKLGRFDAVLPDVETFIGEGGVADESAHYAVFLAAVAARRTGRPDDAARLLARIRPAIPLKSWTLTVLQFMTGELDAAAFLAKADGNGQRTEARTYVAFQLIQLGKLEEARAHLAWVRDKGDRQYTEYELAAAELKRLDAIKTAGSRR
jgi:tetratricopeptide (TPR) repeat protein